MEKECKKKNLTLTDFPTQNKLIILNYLNYHFSHEFKLKRFRSFGYLSSKNKRVNI